VFLLEKMAVRTMPNGSEVRDVVHGGLATGEAVALHETMQPAGTVPTPLHTIEHSELIVVEQGLVAFEHEGRSEVVGPGGVIYVAYGTNHRLRNAGDGPAKYAVVQIGGDTKR
jgi:mannose-6-phosphate isomerase-like protein (cupin superfamily)